MNKRAFTLVEVIGVIIVLGLIALLAFPPMLNMVKNSENKVSDATKNLIYTSSMQYTTKYMNDFPKKEGNVYCLKISDLIKEDYLSTTIVKDEITLETKIKVTISEDFKYEYLIDNKCQEVK